MELLLQWIGGGFYLLNKIFFSRAEHSNKVRCSQDIVRERRYRLASWVSYLIGLPPIVILFLIRDNWIAASVEAAGAPSMVLGLVNTARYRENEPPQWLVLLSRVCIVAGFAVSFKRIGVMTTLNQWLEVGLVVGFLIGTYQLAHRRSSGYLWFVLMHVSCGWLCYIQDWRFLMWQQVASLLFVADAFIMARRNMRRLQLVTDERRAVRF